jgi:predicted DNA-binding protein
MKAERTTRPRGRPVTVAPEDRVEKGVTVKFTQEERQILNQLAKDRGISVAGMLREAFELYLEDFGHRPLTLRLPDETYATLMKLARATGKKGIRSLVTEAIDRYIAAESGTN